MATEEATPIEEVLVTERELWLDGPPHELFKRMRSECPVHWTARISEYPEEDGFWSVTRRKPIFFTFTANAMFTPAVDCRRNWAFAYAVGAAMLTVDGSPTVP